MKIELFDTTLRDGAQARNVSFSLRDKIEVVKLLDKLGIDYIEAGNPASNPKDIDFFSQLEDLKLENSKIVAFGSTRRKNIKASKDNHLKILAECYFDNITIFGKAWDFHVTDIIKTTLEENLLMIEDSIKFLVDNGKTVSFDAEHFFDGYKENKEYAIKVLETAYKAGSKRLVLCDTRGGCFPSEISTITADVVAKLKGAIIGIHVHNDMGMAIANSHAAIDSGSTHVQGTLIGFGERCGNANLSAIIANLQLKQNIKVITDKQMSTLTSTCKELAEYANSHLDDGLPYIGKNAFSHKGGMHIDGIIKSAHSFEHTTPESVGNQRDILISEVSGRTAILRLLNKYDPTLTKNSKETIQIIKEIKMMEQKGYQYEVADASIELLIKKTLKQFIPSFNILYYELRDISSGLNCLCTMKIKIRKHIRLVSAEGEGPVHALDRCLRLILEEFFPSIKEVTLIDYIVRVLDHKEATDAGVRVTIVTTDQKNTWKTMGVSTNIIEASLIALVDSLEYKLMRKEAINHGNDNN